jgi:hypothetical protein
LDVAPCNIFHGTLSPPNLAVPPKKQPRVVFRRATTTSHLASGSSWSLWVWWRAKSRQERCLRSPSDLRRSNPTFRLFSISPFQCIRPTSGPSRTNAFSQLAAWVAAEQHNHERPLFNKRSPRIIRRTCSLLTQRRTPCQRTTQSTDQFVERAVELPCCKKGNYPSPKVLARYGRIPAAMRKRHLRIDPCRVYPMAISTNCPPRGGGFRMRP